MAVLLMACSAPSADPGIDLLTAEYVGGPQLGASGTLDVHERCLVLVEDRTAIKYALVWPDDRVAWEPENRVVHLDGVSVAIGDKLSVTGAPTDVRLMRDLLSRSPACSVDQGFQVESIELD